MNSRGSTNARGKAEIVTILGLSAVIWLDDIWARPHSIYRVGRVNNSILIYIKVRNSIRAPFPGLLCSGFVVTGDQTNARQEGDFATLVGQSSVPTATPEITPVAVHSSRDENCSSAPGLAGCTR